MVTGSGRRTGRRATDLETSVPQSEGETGAVPAWRLWLVPLAAGIFAGAAAFEGFPYALRRAGTGAVAGGRGGLIAFVALHRGPEGPRPPGASGASPLGVCVD